MQIIIRVFPLLLMYCISCTNIDSLDKARGLWHGGDLEEALEVYNRLIETNAENDSFFLDRGYVFLELGFYDQALKDFNHLLRKPDFTIPAMLARSAVFFQRGELEKSISELSMIIRKDPNNYVAFYNRGVVKEKNKVYMRDNDSVEVLFYDMDGRRMTYDYQGALEDFYTAIELNPMYTEAYIQKGCVFTNMGQVDSALANFGKAIEIDPNNYYAYFERGLFFRKINKGEFSLSDFNKAIELNPNDPLIFINRGHLKREFFNDIDGACNDFQKASLMGLKDEYTEYCK